MLQPVVMIPGLLCDARLYSEQVEGLASIAATNVANVSLDDTINAMAERTLIAAPSRFALVGLSMGGYVAFEIMRLAPDRVTRLALISTSASPDTPERAAERRRGIASLGIGRFAGVTRQLLPSLIDPSRVNTPLGETVREMALRVGGEAFLRQQRAILGRSDSRPSLSKITVPTIVIVGSNDVLTPVHESEVIAQGIPQSTLHVLDHCGHLPALECPQDVTELLQRWLSTR